MAGPKINERVISMGYSGKRKPSRTETQLRKQVKQLQSDLTDAQLLAAQQATDNAALTQSVTDLQVLMATNTTTGGVA